MIFNEEEYLKAWSRSYFLKWKKKGLVDPSPSAGYFENAYSFQNSWFWLFSFIVAFIGAIASFGLVGLVTDFKNLVIPVVITGAGCVFLCEGRITHRKGFRSGYIDALLGAAGICAIAIIPLATEQDPGDIYFGVAGTAVFTVLTARYISTFTLVTSFVFFAYFIFTAVEKSISSAFLPFVFMILFGGIYLLSGKIFNLLTLPWKRELLWIRFLSLALLILAGNYGVVRSLSEELMHTQGEISFTWFFYLYSIAFPIFICWYGLRKKFRLELWCGIAGLLAGICGIRMFHSIMPLEYALVMGGIVLLTIGCFVLVFLKRPIGGLSLQSSNESGISKLNNLVIAVAVGNKDVRDDHGHLDSGGQFGGGGAGSKY